MVGTAVLQLELTQQRLHSLCAARLCGQHQRRHALAGFAGRLSALLQQSGYSGAIAGSGGLQQLHFQRVLFGIAATFPRLLRVSLACWEREKPGHCVGQRRGRLTMHAARDSRPTWAHGARIISRS